MNGHTTNCATGLATRCAKGSLPHQQGHLPAWLSIPIVTIIDVNVLSLFELTNADASPNVGCIQAASVECYLLSTVLCTI